MNCPTIAGWLNIAAVSLNALGVLTLFYFRGLPIGGTVSRSLPPRQSDNLVGA
jgi:hypothetical protein